jgi:hypothetical protein
VIFATGLPNLAPLVITRDTCSSGKAPELQVSRIQQESLADASYAAPSMPCGSRTNFFGSPRSNSS